MAANCDHLKKLKCFSALEIHGRRSRQENQKFITCQINWMPIIRQKKRCKWAKKNF
ncbi:hypothetical protein KsCSTR_48930 [Candidatus Kuenenia stuttgartiensis]|uniref:Uncharacterized protein n=1 Tax=Kuenenia stuttgartiensis TaxID=174633 RepID=A0A6G7GXD3_KUEST|nr:hypothetical protein KsCSTR_48930 [Candidatus Kuenenia stuttgartiensis]